MIDGFKHHSNDWSRVPRPEAPRAYLGTAVMPLSYWIGPQEPGQLVVYTKPMLSVGVAYVLWFFLGMLGGHKFYLGKPGSGVMYALTLGWLGIGLLIDLFTIPDQVRAANRRV